MSPRLPYPSHVPSTPRSVRPQFSRRHRRALNIAVLSVFVLLPLQSAMDPAAATPSRHDQLTALDPTPGMKQAVTKPKVTLTLTRARVTTQQRASAKVAIHPHAFQSAGATAQQLQSLRSGRIKVLVKRGAKQRTIHARLTHHKALVSLPRLHSGVYRVRATFLGNKRLGHATSRYRMLTVVTPPAESGPPADFPNASNTGVPDGVTLTPYTGSCTITADNKVIDSKTIECVDLDIQAANVTIRNSQVNGRIIVDTDVNRSWSLTLSDSDVDAGSGDLSAISSGNVVIERANIRGGHNGLECQEHSSYCSLRDSWIHDQWQAASGDTHLGGVLVLGNQVPCTGLDNACAEIVHNTIVCDAPVNVDGGGCTGDINLLPHFGPLHGAIVEGNYLGANVGSSYCTYGAAGMEYPATNIVYRNNVFQRGTNNKCGAYGPVTNFDSSGTGNVWADNYFDDGVALLCDGQSCR